MRECDFLPDVPVFFYGRWNICVIGDCGKIFDIDNCFHAEILRCYNLPMMQIRINLSYMDLSLQGRYYQTPLLDSRAL